jgi:phosphate transport system ATP-binding protein
METEVSTPDVAPTAEAVAPVTEMEARDVSVWFGQRKVLEGVNMKFPKNSVTALIGPSGCGKSTFIRTLNRLHELLPGAALAGEILYEGKDIYDRSVDPVHIRLAIGMVFQKPNPFPSMSVFDNVAAGLKLAGVARRTVLNEVVERSLRQAALWAEVKDKLKAPGTSLSGGQQQRLCIARALAVSPPVIVMDEPTSALDPISTAKIEELLVELKKDVTVVIVTHNMQQAARISDRTAFFLSGEMVECDDTTQIFTNPKDRRTEQYVTGRFG